MNRAGCVDQVVNESMLTGESLPVLKTAVPVHSLTRAACSQNMPREVKTVVNVWQVVNESMLTGESLPVLKTAVPVHSADDNGFP